MTGAESTRIPDIKRYYARPSGDEFEQLRFEEFMMQYILHDIKPQRSDECIKDGCGLYVTRRKRGKAVCRYHVLLPSAGELYYFQMIVKHMPLRCAEAGLTDMTGEKHPTYQAAALAMGLYQKETEYEMAFAAIVNNFSTPILRSFLVQISIEGAQGHAIMETHYRQLADDINDDDHDLRTAKLLRKLHEEFTYQGKHACDYGFPEAPVIDDPLNDIFNTTTQLRIWNEMKIGLSAEQLEIVQFCLNAMESKAGETKFVFINAPAGYGKTHLARAIAACLRGHGHSICCTATTALAAVLHEGGRTAHSAYGIPVDDSNHVECDERAQKSWKNRYDTGHLWDEAPSCDKKNIEAVEEMFRGLFDSTTRFGGIPLFLLMGDFRQTAPIVPDTFEDRSIYASIKMSHLWSEVIEFTLTRNFRQTDERYMQQLTYIGNGTCMQDPSTTQDEYLVERPGYSYITLPCAVTYQLRDAIEHAYPDFYDTGALSEFDQQHSAILCARNRHVDEINNAMQSIISKCQDTPILTLYSRDTKYEALETETQSHFSHKFLDTINDPGVPPHTLTLQEGDICFLTRNIGFKDGNTNNTKVQITSINMKARVVTIRNLRTGKLHPISRISFILCVKSRKRKAINFQIHRRQFPLRLAYAMTINKSQGQTLQRVALDLREPCFAHGQLYVALGRVPDPSRILVLTTSHYQNTTNPTKHHTINIVHKRLLQ